MDIKCSFDPYFSSTGSIPLEGPNIRFYEARFKPCDETKENYDIFVKRPDAVKRASGLSGFMDKISSYAKSYKKNIKHTVEHKIIYSLVEKELYGKNTVNSLTHDADKMLMYCFGLPRSFVSKFHRKHSSHHIESGKKMNLVSMLCDNIASSPEFKPEKKFGVREYYNSSKELQRLDGFGELLEKYNYGEKLDFKKIIDKKKKITNGNIGLRRIISKSVSLLLFYL